MLLPYLVLIYVTGISLKKFEFLESDPALNAWQCVDQHIALLKQSPSASICHFFFTYKQFCLIVCI